MKMKYKALFVAAMTTPLLLTTSCIEEAIPTSGVIQSQISDSQEYVRALIYGMPGSLNMYGVTGSGNHFEFGNPAVMHARDVMTADMTVDYAGGYDWFASWSSVTIGLDALYTCPAFVWFQFSNEVLSANLALNAIDPETTDEEMQWYRGIAYAFRAAVYLDWARMFEFLPAMYDGALTTTDSNGNSIVGLTVPKVIETTTDEEAANNPRLPHNEMVAFIKSDLDKALELMQTGEGYTRSGTDDKILPDIAVVYGLLARLYLWDATYTEEGLAYANETESAAQLYQQAETYARMAITESEATPMTEEEALSTSTGFNNIAVSSWMWGQNLVSEDDVVRTSIVNWTSFMCNEAQFGYAGGAGAFVSIDALLYSNINDYDFRKLLFVAPAGTPLSGSESYVDAEYAEQNFDSYYSLKFRPGSGDAINYDPGAVVAIPLMRVEEMYLIEAEAAAHRSPADGIEKLGSFMRTYRYPTYRSYVSSLDDVLEEILQQKRVELWGEGQTYFDVKRLNLSVIRAYNGSNFTYGLNTYNTEGRPAWMNMVIPQGELNNNAGINSNNPSPVNANTLIQE